MRGLGLRAAAAVVCASAMAVPARADVVAQSDIGFVVRNAVEVKASPAEAWAVLVRPAVWWQGQHTFSGEPANLTLDPVPGGCFCEMLPVPPGAPKGQRAGGVQHMRVIYAEPGKAMRLAGALGPLQSEALNATLTVTIKPVDGGSRILWEYVVGGFMRYKVEDIAPAVDRVIAAQLNGLAGKLGPVAVVVVPEPKSAGAEPPSPPPPAAPDVSETRGTPELRRSGKVWSLPPAPQRSVSEASASEEQARPETAASAKPAAIKAPPAKPAAPAAKPVTPQPTQPKPEVPAKATAGKATPAKVNPVKPTPPKTSSTKPIPEQVGTPAPEKAAEPAPESAATVKAPAKAAAQAPAKAVAKAPAKAAAKPAPKATESAADKDRRDGIEAFDQAMGGTPPQD